MAPLLTRLAINPCAIQEIDVRPYFAISEEDRHKNIISLGGPKANPYSRRLFDRDGLVLYLRSSYIWDAAKKWALLPKYSPQLTTIVNDFGLITLIPQPVAGNYRLIIAGLKGSATLAAAYLLSDDRLFARWQAVAEPLGFWPYHGQEVIQVLFQVAVGDYLQPASLKILKFAGNLVDDAGNLTDWKLWENADYHGDNHDLNIGAPLLIRYSPYDRTDGPIFWNEILLQVKECSPWKKLVYLLAQKKQQQDDYGGYLKDSEIKEGLQLVPDVEIRRYISRINTQVEKQTGLRLIESGDHGETSYRLTVPCCFIEID